ncbi:MAG: TonB-dependent receptor [Woeseia sp.]|nr:TonB-dependent receptor [Woeseia sp.]
MKTIPLVQRIGGALCVSAALLLSVPAANAQNDGEVLEEIVTTGSRISRNEFSSSSPITVVTGEEVALSGTVSIDEYLKDVPAFTGYQMGTSTNNGSASGQKKLDLRGLGFNRTLVLINGRRMIGDTSGDGAVDLNAIPEAMIKRVEVLKDGASTIYGSDALAGVVNIILHDDFEGVQFSGRYGEGMEDGQAANSSLAMMAGIASDRGNMVASLSYTNQDEMLQAERPFAVDALYPQLDASGNFVAVGAGSSNSRRIRVPGEGNYIWDSSIGAARAYNGATDTYNYSPVNALTQPNERWQIGLNGKATLNDAVEGYVDAIYTRRTSQQRLAPDASFAVNSAIETPNNGLQWNDYVPADNPFNPFGVNAAGPDGTIGTADDLNPLGIENIGVRINRRFEESGGRLFRQTADTYRMAAGLRGTFSQYDIDWDVSYTYAEQETLDETKNYGRFDRWATAVDPVACAADAACPGVLNPFFEFGSITPAQMAYLSTGSLKDLIGGRMEMGAINLNGAFGEMGGGSIGWAFGYEHRKESGLFSPDEFLAAGLTTGGASDPLNGKFSVDEIYGELLLPFSDNFEVSTSVRFSDYDTVGSSTTYKIGGDWAVNDSMRLRATYATGFRAPNIAEINQEDAAGFPVIESLCEFADRRLAAGDITQQIFDNCLALLGTAAGGDDSFVSDGGEFGFAWQSLLTTRAPTQKLEAEESTSYTAGVVFQPSFADGLSIGIDYWNIEIEQVIGNADMNDLFYPCLNSPNLTDPTCDAFDFGPYDLGIVFIFPGDATLDFGNLGTLTTDGVDVDVVYNGELNTSWAQGFDLSWSTTFTNSYEEDFKIAKAELVGTADGFGVFPEVRMNFGIGFYGDNWTVDYSGRYIGETDDRRRPCYLTDDCKAESIYYSDLVGTYTWENVTFNLGFRNLTDETPPRFHSAFNANTEPGMYDVVGRAYYAGFKLTF